MGILSRIGEAKAKFKTYQSDKSQRANVIKAEKLKELREERIRLEGKANLEKLQARERARIQTAKQNSGLTGKLKGYAKKAQGARQRLKASRFGASTSGGIQFGGSSSSGGGIDFGGRNTPSNTFGFGGSSKPKTEDKPKPKRIIINI